MAGYKPPRRMKGGSHAHKVKTHQKHRRSGAHKGFTRRVNNKLFKGRVVNAPRNRW